MKSAIHYYADKVQSLCDLFGTQDVRLRGDTLIVNGDVHQIVDDVIVLADTDSGVLPANDIRETFSAEWNAFDRVLTEHEAEFRSYFDLVELDALRQSRVADLGCGIGRWSWFLRHRCRELVLVDFSDAVFIARRNLSDAANVIYFKANIQNLPFRNNAFDLAFSLGVLHHLPVGAIGAVRSLAPLAPQLLVYLYYALDNRPWHYRAMLAVATRLRRTLWRMKSQRARLALSWLLAVTVYKPLVWFGHLLRPLALHSHVPLYDFYHGKSLRRVQQDVYDRFFTRIEQRVSRQEITALKDAFGEVVISTEMPYWHFLCTR